MKKPRYLCHYALPLILGGMAVCLPLAVYSLEWTGMFDAPPPALPVPAELVLVFGVGWPVLTIMGPILWLIERSERRWRRSAAFKRGRARALMATAARAEAELKALGYERKKA